LETLGSRDSVWSAVALAPLSLSVDEFAGTVSQGSPERLRGYRWADGFEFAERMQASALRTSV